MYSVEYLARGLQESAPSLEKRGADNVHTQHLANLCLYPIYCAKA
jgi:hypothetical protein